MVCSFCGTDNRSENRFCGNCGVRLDRRMADRRVNRDAVQLKCQSCSHVNEAGYKFCGQCGARVDRRIHERRGSAMDSKATAGANASLPTPEYSRLQTSGSNVAISGERESINRDLGLRSPGDPNPGIFVSDTSINDGRREGTTREELRNAEVQHERLRSGDRRGDGQHNEALRDELAREEMRRDMSLRHDPAQPLVRERPLRETPTLRRESSFEGAESRPGIIGPSFLGIGNEPESEGEYLLEDESGSGAGFRRLILLVVLAAIVGLIFMQYRSSLRANPKTPEMSPSAAPGRGSITSPSGATPGGNSSDPKVLDNSGTDSGTVSADSSKTAVGAKTTKKDQGDVDEPGILPNAADRNPAEAGSAATTSKTTEMTKPVSSGSVGDSTRGSDSTRGATTPSAGGTKPSAVVDTAAVDPAVNAKPSATLVRAQQFLQGRGVPQNCEQGLVYLRAAAQKNEPAAAVQMGALYSAGHCVKQDRVMAYRWFNSAHELQPGNQWIQKSMDQLWAQMNEQERRLSGY
jgi:hypothetical protein